MEKKGFTLAEVLITLAIIGVVAALTIPTVVRNYQKTQTVTQLKKTYSALSNTTNLAIAEQGPIAGWVVYNYNETVPGTSLKGSEYFAKTYLMPYLKVSKDCGTATSGNCAYVTRWMNGNDMGAFNSSAYYKFVLNDGAIVAVAAQNFVQDGYTYIRANLFLDINGQKKPNIGGKDVHELLYFLQGNANPGKFVPWGYTRDREDILHNPSWGCNKNATSTTEFCTALIMRDGWQMKDDYPW